MRYQWGVVSKSPWFRTTPIKDLPPPPTLVVIQAEGLNDCLDNWVIGSKIARANQALWGQALQQ